MTAKGRASTELVGALKQEIAGGRFPAGAYLPGQRELAESHGVARNTVRRALRTLELAGFVSAEPRRGYRVLAAANDPARGAPVAFMLSEENILGGWDVLYRRLGRCLETEASRRGWRMMQLVARREQMVGVFEQLRESRACGLIVDSVSAEILSAAAATGLPVVVVDAWSDDEGVDVVVQDNFRGGEQAAEHLAALGRRRIAWFSPALKSYHARARYGGATAALAARGMSLAAIVEGSFRSEAALEAALEMLSAPDAPDAVLALWRPQYIAVRDAARRRGLALGRDLDLVGWCVEEAHAADFAPLFAGGPAPAAVTWSAARMAAAAVAALEARRRDPRRPATRTLVPTRLKYARMA